MVASRPASTVAPTGTGTTTEPRRYLALDAYPRGFIMLLLASEGFGFSILKGDPTWGRVAGWFDHVPWEGLVFWDLIQPAFMFMVGVAMPFALAGADGSRRQRTRQLPRTSPGPHKRNRRVSRHGGRRD